jgi:NitT/TauT family transport system ATP-binding protein
MGYPPAIQVEGVSKAFSGGRKWSARSHVLFEFNMSLEAGRSLAMLGPSGGGKTSLLRIIAGLEIPDQGSVRVFGAPPLPQTRAGEISLISGDSTLLPWRSAIGNVILPLDLLGDRNNKQERAEELLDSVFLRRSLWNNRPDELSEGQRQRVRLAQGLISKPKLVLLDEPFSNVDEGLRGVLVDVVIDYLQKLPERSAVLVTHHAYEAASLAHEIFILVNKTGEAGPAQLCFPKVLLGAPGKRERLEIEEEEDRLRAQMIDLQRQRTTV